MLDLEDEEDAPARAAAPIRARGLLAVTAAGMLAHEMSGQATAISDAETRAGAIAAEPTTAALMILVWTTVASAIRASMELAWTISVLKAPA